MSSVADTAAAKAEGAVRSYLRFLEDPDQLVDPDAVKRLEDSVAAARDPVDKLKALAELEKARRPDASRYEEAFIRAAKVWADANEIAGQLFSNLGVDREVLEAAGLLPRAPTSSRQRRQNIKDSKSTSVGVIKAHIRNQKGEFKLASIAAAVGGSPMTLRKAVNQLIAEGVVQRLGPDPQWRQPGRAPILFRRA